MDRRTFRWDVAWVIAALLAASVWIDLGKIHRHQNADSLVMVLISLYRWTPLFWEQNRLGMLVPALALPFRHPLANLLVQSGLTILSGLAGSFLLGYYVAGRRRGMAAGAVAGLLFVVALRIWQQFDYLVYIHQYATSLSLSLLALILLARWRLRFAAPWWRPAAACLLIWLAMWVNPSLAFALGPLVLLRRFLLGNLAAEFDRQDEPPADDRPGVGQPALLAGYPAADWLALLATASGLLMSMLISRYATEFQESYSFLPPRQWLACAVALVRNLPRALHPAWLAAVTATALSGLVTLIWPAGRRALPGAARLVLGLLLPAAVQFAFVSSLDHVHRTDYSRYAFAAVFLVQGACVVFAVVQWLAVLPDTPGLRRVPYGLVALFCVVAAGRHGLPSLERVRTALQEAAGQVSGEVLAERCTHVTGDYYHVWPTVFHANLLLADQGAPYTVWGIAQRSLPTADLWTRAPLAETRIAEIRGDERQSRGALTHYGITPIVVDHDGEGIRVLRPGVPLSQTPAGRYRR